LGHFEITCKFLRRLRRALCVARRDGAWISARPPFRQRSHHGGTVDVHSVVGEGSEFVVRLPVLRTAMTRSPLPAVETVAPPGTGCRVLIVDDSVDTARSLAMLLTTSGHDVRIAHDGPTALEASLNPRAGRGSTGCRLAGNQRLRGRDEDASATRSGSCDIDCHDRVRPGSRPSAFARGRLRSSPGQAGRLQQGAENPGWRRADEHEVTLKQNRRFALALLAQ
jgi:hypothetical protein